MLKGETSKIGSPMINGDSFMGNGNEGKKGEKERFMGTCFIG